MKRKRETKMESKRVSANAYSNRTIYTTAAHSIALNETRI